MAVSNLLTIAEYAKSFAREDIRRPPIETVRKMHLICSRR